MACSFFKSFVVVLLLSLLIDREVGSAHDHGHDHGHHRDHEHGHHEQDSEPAHFKYSRTANEPPATSKHERSDVRHYHSGEEADYGDRHHHAHEAHHHSQGHHVHEQDHQHHHHQHVPHHVPQEPKRGFGAKSDDRRKKKRLANFDEEGLLGFLNDPTTALYVYAIGSTLLISFAPFLLLYLIPVSSNATNQPLLKVLLAFASGGLLGDALLHLIPHALMAQSGGAHSHSHSHSHRAVGGEGEESHAHDLSVGLWVLMGIVAFLVVEKVVRIAKGGGGGHSHSHSHSASADSEVKKSSVEHETLRKRKRKPKQHSSGEEENDTEGEQPSEHSSANRTEDDDGEEEEEEHNHDHEEVAVRDIKVAGYLNLAADFAHNFTDGLAVGASYLAGTHVGVVTTVTVLFHEVPHEIGDFAILIQSGCSKRNAMFLQLLTAVGALLGCIISICTADPEALAEKSEMFVQAAAASWVLPFTAGGFIYVATVSVIPELLEDSGLAQSIKEVLALFFGIFLMILIAKFE